MIGDHLDAFVIVCLVDIVEYSRNPEEQEFMVFGSGENQEQKLDAESSSTV